LDYSDARQRLKAHRPKAAADAAVVSTSDEKEKERKRLKVGK
jgi:hypothetical protein